MIFPRKQQIFFSILKKKREKISKMGTKINLRIMTENHAADPEIGFFVKWILSRLDS